MSLEFIYILLNTAAKSSKKMFASLTQRRFKFRLKSLHRRKKDERLLLDMPTTDPGSDLLCSTDDEHADANGALTCYETMPPRIRRHLLKSKLQRRYIEEIGDSLRNMPPELIITSPSNNGKQKIQPLQIVIKPAAANRYGQKSQTGNEFIFLGQSAKRTSSCHNLNTAGQTPRMTRPKPCVTKNKAQSPFYNPLSTTQNLSKEDLDIKLSLKKKIWAGIQQDENSICIDQTRPLSSLVPNSLKSKEIAGEQNLNTDLNVTKLSNRNNFKRLENEAFLKACSRKLMEWQSLNTKPDKTPESRKTKVTLKRVVPDNINEDRAMDVFKQLASTTTPNSFAKPNSEINSETKPKRTAVSKPVRTVKNIPKSAKPKSRNTTKVLTSHRAATKKIFNQHKSHLCSNKFKTRSLVLKAAQKNVGGVIDAAKKNKKLKSHHKIHNDNSSNANNPECAEPRRLPSQYNNSNKNSLAVAATATTIVQKVKTKFKKNHIQMLTEKSQLI